MLFVMCLVSHIFIKDKHMIMNSNKKERKIGMTVYQIYIDRIRWTLKNNYLIV